MKQRRLFALASFSILLLCCYPFAAPCLGSTYSQIYQDGAEPFQRHAGRGHHAQCLQKDQGRRSLSGGAKAQG